MSTKRPLSNPSSPKTNPQRIKLDDDIAGGNFANFAIQMERQAATFEDPQEGPARCFHYAVHIGKDCGYKIIRSLEDIVPRKAELYFLEHPDIKEKTCDAISSGNFKKLLRAIVVTPANLNDPQDTLDQSQATLQSWSQEYEGNAAGELWKYIIDNKPRSSKDSDYAKYTAIVQSSGSGKSRAVDEIAKKHLVIPLCLRSEDSTGFPPADAVARDYLVIRDNFNEDRACKRSLAFLQATFLELTKFVDSLENGITFKRFVKLFRNKMTEDQSFECPNEFRQTFYENIVNEASQREGVTRIPHSPSKNRKGVSADDSDPEPAEDAARAPVKSSFQNLIKTVKKKCRLTNKEMSGELIVLALDEADGLCIEFHGGKTCFHQFRTALRHLRHENLFSIFLATTGKATQFVSASKFDPSDRVGENKLFLLKPFIDFPFDLFANPSANLELDHNDLNQISSEAYMIRFGRPLFYTRYTTLEHKRRKIVEFAAWKLLQTTDLNSNEEERLTMDQQFACLAQRFPLEFISSHYLTSGASDIELRQVDSHMRVCLNFSDDMLTMRSVSASEPILSEAAFALMQRAGFSACNSFRRIFDGFPVNKGDRGEFVALLLVTLARDAVVVDQNGSDMWKEMMSPADSEDSKGWNRVVSVKNFLVKLLKDTSDPIFKQLFKTFQGTNLHFNHFIKVNSAKILHVMRLALLLRRGAAILCMNCQRGVDFVIPCHGKFYQVIVGQVKNDASYSNFDQHLFEAMSPVNLMTGKLHSMIRIVFALAALTPSVEIRESITKNHDGTDCIAYDIWIAGTSPKFLRPIKENEEKLYKSLCEPAGNWKEVFKYGGNTRKSTYAACTDEKVDRGFWSSWCTEKELDILPEKH